MWVWVGETDRSLDWNRCLILTRMSSEDTRGDNVSSFNISSIPESWSNYIIVMSYIISGCGYMSSDEFETR